MRVALLLVIVVYGLIALRKREIYSGYDGDDISEEDGPPTLSDVYDLHRGDRQGSLEPVASADDDTLYLPSVDQTNGSITPPKW